MGHIYLHSSTPQLPQYRFFSFPPAPATATVNALRGSPSAAGQCRFDVLSSPQMHFDQTSLLEFDLWFDHSITPPRCDRSSMSANHVILYSVLQPNDCFTSIYIICHRDDAMYQIPRLQSTSRTYRPTPKHVVHHKPNSEHLFFRAPPYPASGRVPDFSFRRKLLSRRSPVASPFPRFLG